MSKYILFIQISELSYDESFLIERLSQQLDADYQVLALVNGMSSALVSSRPERIVGVLTENQEDNLTRFQAIFEKTTPEAIILIDLHQYFLKPADLNFLPIWLKDSEIPVLALDYFNLLQAKDGVISLNEGVKTDLFESGEEPLPLDYPIHLLKPIPPILPESVSHQSCYLWNPLDYSLHSSQHELRKQVFDSLSLTNETRLVTLLFDPTLFAQAIEQGIMGFFFAAVEVIIYYLRQFQGQEFQILVVGSLPPTDQVNEIPDLNVKIQYFTHLTEDNYRAFLAASDLIVANNNWSLITLDAMSLATPVCVLGNSIIQDWKDETETEKMLTSFFKPAPALYELCHLMLNLNQWSISLPIFQFINYPMRFNDPDFPDPGLQPHAFPYFLLDMFDDETSEPILRELLFSTQFKERYQKFCQQLLQISEQGLSLPNILKQIKTP